MNPEPVTVTVWIRRITEEQTRSTARNPNGLRRFQISAEDVRGQVVNIDRFVALATFDQWKASLCQRAQERNRPVVLTWRDLGFFDKDIVSVRLESEVTA